MLEKCSVTDLYSKPWNYFKMNPKVYFLLNYMPSAWFSEQGQAMYSLG